MDGKDDGSLVVLGQGNEALDDVVGVVGIKTASGFVEEQDRRTGDQLASDSDASLLFSSLLQSSAPFLTIANRQSPIAVFASHASQSNMARQSSALSQVLPLIIVFALLSVGGWIGYQVYISVAKMSDAASERMGKKNVVFTKDGVKVGVKQIKNENYVDATQSWFVKAWNLGTTSDASQSKKQK